MRQVLENLASWKKNFVYISVVIAPPERRRLHPRVAATPRETMLQRWEEFFEGSDEAYTMVGEYVAWSTRETEG